MLIKKRNRKFIVGKKKNILLIDKGSIYLKKNENISIHFNKQINYDIVKKNWGFYPLPSLNKRLWNFNLKSVLVKNKKLKTFFIMLVINDKKKISEFKKYCKNENLEILLWINNKNLTHLEKPIKK